MSLGSRWVPPALVRKPWDDSEPDFRHAHRGFFGRDSEVRGEGEFESAAEAVSVDQGEGRHGDFGEEVEDFAGPVDGLDDLGRRHRPALLKVGARAKGLGRAGVHHHGLDLIVVVDPVRGGLEVVQQRGREGVSGLYIAEYEMADLVLDFLLDDRGLRRAGGEEPSGAAEVSL